MCSSLGSIYCLGDTSGFGAGGEGTGCVVDDLKRASPSGIQSLPSVSVCLCNVPQFPCYPSPGSTGKQPVPFPVKKGHCAPGLGREPQGAFKDEAGCHWQQMGPPW